MNVVVDSATRLERVSENAGVSKFAEVYYNWPTGFVVDLPATASTTEIVEGYKAARSI